jgi:hypothetical protein
VIGITAVAGALAYFSLQGVGAEAAMGKLEDTLSNYRRTEGRVQSDTQKLTQLNEELTEAIKTQQRAIELTKRAEIAALSERIAKNQDLLRIQGELANSQLGLVRSSVRSFSSPTLGERLAFSPKDQLRKELSAKASVEPGTLIGVDDQTRQTQFMILLNEQVNISRRLQDAGEVLNDKQRAALELKQEFLELQAKEAALAEDVALTTPRGRFEAFVESRSGFIDLSETAAEPETKASDEKAAKDNTLAALEEIRKAHNATFDTEIEAVERVYRARIEAINKSSAGEMERAALTIQAEEILSAEIGKIKAEQDAEDAAYAEARAARIKDQTDSEIQLLDEILYARDAAFGRTLALIEREFTARRAEVEAEIEDAARRNEALAALEDEKAKVIADVRERALDEARDFTERDVIQSEVDRIHDEAQARIDAIEAAYGGEIEAHQDAQDAITAIIAEANEQIVALGRERLQGYVDDVGSIFGSLAGIIEDYGGKSSGAYKALIAVERAFAFASISLKIAQAVSQALADPTALTLPQKIANFATITALGAQALAMLAPKGGFQRGGHTGYGADTDVRGYVHANEYVQPAPVVSHYGVDIMRALQFRRIPKHLLQGYQRGGYVGAAPPAVMRTAERITASAASAATSIRNTSNVFNIQQGNVTVTGGGDSNVAAELRAELRESEGRIAAKILPALANDIRRGGSDVTEALQDAYALSRRGS